MASLPPGLFLDAFGPALLQQKIGVACRIRRLNFIVISVCQRGCAKGQRPMTEKPGRVGQGIST